MKLPSIYVLKRTAGVTLIAAVISISVSTGIRIILGTQADTVTIIVRLLLPFIIAIPLGIVWFTKLERLEDAYRSLVKHANHLARSASLDPLTGLLNRRSFVEQFNSAMQMEVRGWFLIADIDYLKMINDTYGHLAGDEAVITAAQVLMNTLPADSLIGRIGGDEFCAFIAENDEVKIEELAQKIGRQNIFSFKSHGEMKAAQFSMTLGYMMTKPRQTFRDVMGQSDERLYRKKRARNLPLSTEQNAQ